MSNNQTDRKRPGLRFKTRPKSAIVFFENGEAAQMTPGQFRRFIQDEAKLLDNQDECGKDTQTRGRSHDG